MLNHYDPDDYVPVITRHVCEHHKRDPWDTAWPGCTCSSSYGSRKATPEERAENVRQRKVEEERRRKYIADYDARKGKK